MIKQIISILMLLIFVSPASAWWDDDWNYRREIIINHSMVNHTQSNFPIMIQITTSGLNDNGTDARFTDSNDNELAREIEYYNSTSKVLTAFFNVTTLSNTSDTIIYLYSGNPSASEPAADSTYGSQAVWSNDYFDINLMADTSDSTGEGNTLSLVGTPTVGDMDYGKGYVLNGGTDYLRLTANADMRAMDYTTIKFSIDNSDASIQRIITWHDSTNGGEWNIKRETGGEIKFAYITGGAWAYKTILVSYVVDQEYIITLSKTDGTTMAIYLDGSLVDIVINMEQDGGYGAQHFYIGASHIGTQILNGNIAILYLGGIIKFENYIITIHNNLNNPTTTGTAPFFLSFGSEEHCPKIPPNPTNLDHTKGFFWVNHTWEAGTGNITDSYNVSHNSVWYNNTINSYYYSGDIGDGGYSEILIYAYNNSGFLSEEYVTQNISAPPYIPPPAPINLQYTKGEYWVNHTWDEGLDEFTNSYNISHNESWTNGSSNTYFNSGQVGRNGISTIIVYAYNGILSEGYITQTISTKPGIGYERKIVIKNIQSMYFPLMFILLMFIIVGAFKYMFMDKK